MFALSNHVIDSSAAARGAEAFRARARTRGMGAGIATAAVLAALGSRDQDALGGLEVGAGGRPPQEWLTSACNAGTGRPHTFDPTDEPCAVKPPRCDCHVVGGNTLNTAGLGTASQAARFGNVTIDSGDASAFVPYYIFVCAFQVGGAAPTTTIQGNPLMVLLTNSKSGQNPNMRRASDDNPAFGVATLVYGQDKELECVDWRKFSSTNNQQIVMRFFNSNSVTVHVFVDLWGVPLS